MIGRPVAASMAMWTLNPKTNLSPWWSQVHEASLSLLLCLLHLLLSWLGFVADGQSLTHAQMMEQSRGDPFPFDDACLDEPYHSDSKDFDDPLRPDPLGELVEGRPVGNPVNHPSVDAPPQVQGRQQLLVLPEEPHQVEDAVHAKQVHHQQGPEHRAGRVPLRAVPVRPVKIDYPVDIEVVVLEEQAGGEEFPPDWFRFLVLPILRPAAEKPT
jgi:hypothetical protein